MRKFQTLKLSQFQKAKTCWTENWWSCGVMSSFLGEFFMFWGSKKNFEIFFLILGKKMIFSLIESIRSTERSIVLFLSTMYYTTLPIIRTDWNVSLHLQKYILVDPKSMDRNIYKTRTYNRNLRVE